MTFHQPLSNDNTNIESRLSTSNLGSATPDIDGLRTALINKRRRDILDASGGGPIKDTEPTIGLALSGGGVRSASFSAGVLVGLQKTNLLREIDVISSVSGGGYVPLSIMANIEMCNADKVFETQYLYKAILRGVLPFNFYKYTALVKSIMGIGNGIIFLLSLLILASTLATLMITKIFGQNFFGSFMAVNGALGFFYVIARLFRRIKLIKTAYYHYKDVFPQTVWLLNVLGLAYFVYAQNWFVKYGALIVALVILGLLSRQDNPKNNWRLYWLRGAASVLLKNGKAVVAATAAMVIIGVGLLDAFNLLAKPHVKDYSNKFYFILGIAFLFFAIWPSRRSNKVSMFHSYQKYLNALLPSIVNNISFAARKKQRTWFPICVANISILSEGIYKHAAISPFGIEMPNEKLFDWGSVSGDEIVSYRGAMTLSGAAIDIGITTSRLYRYLMTTFGVNTGLWLRSDNDGKLSTDGPIRLLDLMLTLDDGLSRDEAYYMRASDGGHFENTGIYYLLKAKISIIFSFDASYDPNDTGESLRVLFARARQNLSIDFEMVSDNDGISKFLINYENGEVGILYYVKHSKVALPAKNWAKDVSADFPNDSTANQFLSPDLFDSYYELGLHAARNAALCHQSS